ncbi:unnamed protein product [Amoebophrya sp. A120]|nr:unnamed protein product [Amoebophrya sp. A120]|eukprot:GSA120T00020214001.1
MVCSRKSSHEGVDAPNPDAAVQERVQQSRLQNRRLPARRHAVIFTPEQAAIEFANVAQELEIRNSRDTGIVPADVDEDDSCSSSGCETPQRTESPNSMPCSVRLGSTAPADLDFGINEAARQLQELRLDQPALVLPPADGPGSPSTVSSTPGGPSEFTAAVTQEQPADRVVELEGQHREIIPSYL